MLDDFSGELSLLLHRALLDASLEDAAAVFVGGYEDDAGCDFVEDELVVGHVNEGTLHDVVAVQVANQRHDIATQSRLEQLHFSRRVGAHGLNEPLHCARAMHVQIGRAHV